MEKQNVVLALMTVWMFLMTATIILQGMMIDDLRDSNMNMLEGQIKTNALVISVADYIVNGVNAE